MNRVAIVERLLREMTEEVPVLLHALPDEALWQTMAAGLLADEDAEVLAARLSGCGVSLPGAPDWRDVYREMRSMVNAWPAAEGTGPAL